MRILHVADRLSDRGGADWALLGLLDALSARHEQHLAVGRDDGVVRPPCPVTVIPELDARARADAPLDPLLARLRPDRVHVHNVVNPAVLAWAAGVDAVVTIQDHRFFCPGRGKWTADGRVCGDALGRETCAGCFDDVGYFERIFELTTQRLEAVRRLRLTVLSSYMRRELLQAGIPADRIAVVPPVACGLHPDAPADGPPCVLFAGRVVAAKGIRDAVDAWRRSGSGLPLVVAGTGPLRREIEAEGVEVLGWLDRRRLSAAYRRATVLVMPSRWQEPFGIVGLEALTLGTPVAAWDSGGVREWHPGGELLAPWGDVDGLAAALRSAPDHAVDAPRGFGPEDLVRRLEAVYDGRPSPEAPEAPAGAGILRGVAKAWRCAMLRVLVLLASVLGVVGGQPLDAQTCDPAGDVKFVCGTTNPEDLYPVPGAPWVIASGRYSATEGPVYAVSLRDHSAREIFPAGALPPEHDRDTYRACPGPNDVFQPHGLTLREGRGAVHTLYVVGHGAREAIEVFALDVGGAVPTMKWIGCIPAPEGTARINSITALPDGRLGATNFDREGGELWEWHPATGWVEVPGSRMPGPNGLVSSDDGQWFYIGGWSDRALVRLSRGQDPVRIDRIAVGFNVDNVRWGANGKVIAAGHLTQCEDIDPCEPSAARVAEVDPTTFEVRQLVDYNGNEFFRLGTVAIEVNDEIWIGGIRGSYGIARFPR